MGSEDPAAPGAEAGAGLQRAALVAWGLKLGAATLGWYVVAAALSLYNKWLLCCEAAALALDPSACDFCWVASFKFPVTMSLCHMILKGCFARLAIQLGGIPLPDMTWREFLLTNKASKIGVCTGLDVACSNLSITFVTVSFRAMVQPCSLLWTCALGILLKLERPSLTLLAVVLAIFGGTVLASHGEASFSLPGLALALLSTMFAAARWVCTHIMLRAETEPQGGAVVPSGGGSAPIVLLYLVSPSATLSLLPLVLYLEGARLRQWFATEAAAIIAQSAGLVFLAGMMASILVLSELYVVALTSSLSMSVIGMFQGVVTIAAAVALFGDEINLLNGLGVVVTLGGVAAYNRHRYSAMREKAQRRAPPEQKGGAAAGGGGRGTHERERLMDRQDDE